MASARDDERLVQARARADAGSAAAGGAGETLVFVHALRAFAAVAVVCYHLRPHLEAGGVDGDDFWSRAVASVGYIGLDAFFVTSGYMMWRLTRDRSGWHDASSFLLRRVARIYLGYWPILALAALLLVVYRGGARASTSWWLSVTLVPWPFGPTSSIVPDRLVIPPAWTLFYELWFYVLLALAVGFGWRRRMRFLAWSGLAVAAAFVVAVTSGAYASPARMLASSLVPTLYLSPYLAEFYGGMVVAHASERFRVGPAALWLVVAALATGFVVWGNANLAGGALNSGPATPIRVLVALPAALAWLAAAVALDQRGVRRGERWLVPLGESTYAIYLLHTVVLTWIVSSGLHGTLYARGWIVPGYLAAVAVTIAAAVIYTRRIDRPARAIARTIAQSAAARDRVDRPRA